MLGTALLGDRYYQEIAPGVGLIRDGAFSLVEVVQP